MNFASMLRRETTTQRSSGWPSPGWPSATRWTSFGGVPGQGTLDALRHLAGWLADQRRLDELRELLTDHRELLASSWESTHGRHQTEVLRLKADLGDDHARQILIHWLARMREQAQAGNEYAQRALAEWQDR